MATPVRRQEFTDADVHLFFQLFEEEGEDPAFLFANPEMFRFISINSEDESEEVSGSEFSSEDISSEEGSETILDVAGFLQRRAATSRGHTHQSVSQVAGRVSAAAQVAAPAPSPRNYLVFNPFSNYWNIEKLQGMPYLAPIMYIAGMVSYALSLTLRVVIFVLTLFNVVFTFFKSLFSGHWDSMGRDLKVSVIIFVGAAGEMAAAIVGTLCPPAGYKLDEVIQSNPIIYGWYHEHFLSHWYFRTAPGGVGNEHRMAALKVELKDYNKYFVKAKAELKDLISADEIEGMAPQALYQITDLGFLLALADGQPLEVFKTKALEKCNGAEQGKVAEELDGYIKKFLTIQRQIVDTQRETNTNFLRNLPFIGRFFNDGNVDAKLSQQQLIQAIKKTLVLMEDDQYLAKKAETRKQLEAELKPLEAQQVTIEGKQVTLRMAIKAMAEAMRSFSRTARTTNREVETTVMKAAYQS